jgi:hypothetical protein
MSPSFSLFNSSPHEVCFGKNPLLSHLRVFVYDAFFHVPKAKRNNLYNKEVKCIFITYKDGMKGYKLWYLLLRKIVCSRDVIFTKVIGTSMFEEVKIAK